MSHRSSTGPGRQRARLQRRRDRPIFPSGSLAGALERWQKANCRPPFGARLFSAYFHFQFAADYYPRGGWMRICVCATRARGRFHAAGRLRARSVPALSNKINAFSQRKSFAPPIITLISTARSLHSRPILRPAEFTQKVEFTGFYCIFFLLYHCVSGLIFDISNEYKVCVHNRELRGTLKGKTGAAILLDSSKMKYSQEIKHPRKQMGIFNPSIVVG